MKQMSVLVIAFILSTLISASGLGSTALAAVIRVEGVLEARSGKPVLNTGTVRLNLNPVDQHVSGELNRLRPGDYLIGYGEFTADTKSVELQGIETVGLKALIGRWAAKDGQVFEFRTFDKLIHHKSAIREWVNYAKSFLSNSTTLVSRELNYTLAPDSKQNRWSIFVADKLALLIGYVEFGDRSIRLTLIDPKSGRTVQKVELRQYSR